MFDKGFSDMKNILNDFKSNRLLRLALLFGAFFSVNTFPMRMTTKGKVAVKRWAEQLQKKEAIKKGLLIFLDDQEKNEFGAVSFDLLPALYQEAGPIIVSTSLLCTLREYWQKDSRPIKVLLDERESIKDWKEQSSFSKIALSRVCFREECWIIKKINNSLNLLIPLQHLNPLNIMHDKVKEFDSTMGINTVSDIELQLGFKVNHMETVDFRLITRPSADVFSRSARYFVDSLDIIFCKKFDYINKEINIPEWCIFIDGHGDINKSIAHLTLDEFKIFLNFLEKEIITWLLVIFSCYAAGVNAHKIYGELKLGTQQYYSFPIIIQGLNDSATASSSVSINWPTWKYSKFLHLDMGINFTDFLEKAKKLEGNNYNEVIKPLRSSFIVNTPQIKLPGIEWFSLMEVDKNVVSIGSILAKTRDSQTPLNLIKQKPKAILLYTDNIPFELKIDLDGLGGIFSMVSSGPMHDKPEFVIHRIKKIFIGRFDSFMLLLNRIKFEGSKWFFIDEVETHNNIYKNVLIFLVEGEPSVFTGQEPIKCYFKDENNNLFTQGLSGDKEKSGLWDKWDYRSKMSVVQKYLDLTEKQEITPEHIKRIENVLIEQPEKLKEAYTVSEPSVD